MILRVRRIGYQIHILTYARMFLRVFGKGQANNLFRGRLMQVYIGATY